MQSRGYENARIRLRRLCRGAAGRCAGRPGEPRHADEAHVQLQKPLRSLDGPDARTARRRLVDHALRRPVSLLRIYVPRSQRLAAGVLRAARHRGADRSLSQSRGVRSAVGQALLDSVERLRGGQPFGFYRAVLPRQSARPQFPLPVLLHRPSGAFAGAARPHSGPILRHGTRRTGVVGHGRRRRDVVVVCLQRNRALHLFPGRSRIYRHRAVVRQGRSVAG